MGHMIINQKGFRISPGSIQGFVCTVCKLKVSHIGLIWAFGAFGHPESPIPLN